MLHKLSDLVAVHENMNWFNNPLTLQAGTKVSDTHENFINERKQFTIMDTNVNKYFRFQVTTSEGGNFRLKTLIHKNSLVLIVEVLRALKYV